MRNDARRSAQPNTLHASCTHSCGVPLRLKEVNSTSTRCPGPARKMYRHWRDELVGFSSIGALNVPFCGPPGRDTNVWSHSVRRVAKMRRQMARHVNVNAELRSVHMQCDEMVSYANGSRCRLSCWRVCIGCCLNGNSVTGFGFGFGDDDGDCRIGLWLIVCQAH